MRLFIMIFCVLTAGIASAQVGSVTPLPPSPTTLTPVTLRVSAADPCTPVTFLRTGNAIRVDVPSTCLLITAPYTDSDMLLGYLPAGTYDYDVYENGSLDRSGTFNVSDAGPHGQFATIAIQPAQPTTQSSVVMNVTLPSTCGPVTFTRMERFIRVEVPDPDTCVIPAFSTTPLQIGYLPPGTTMYAVFTRDGTLDSAGSFAVIDAGFPFTPALSPPSLLGLAALLAALGWLILRRI